MPNLNDKPFWIVEGTKSEKLFVEKYGKVLGVDINPAKRDNPYVIDMVTDTGMLADLKTQSTPFKSSDRKWGIPPDMCFTFDEYSALRYHFYHASAIWIYLWVRHVKPERVYRVFMHDLRIYMLTRAKIHIQDARKDLPSQNRAVYVLDLRDHIFKQVI